MKVKDLIEKLREVNPELDVVLTIYDEDYGDSTSWELQDISLGWEPSGVISLQSDNCIRN